MKSFALTPHLEVQCKDGAAWYVKPECLERLLALWQAGKTFAAITLMTGATLHIKLADVVGVVVMDAAAIEVAEAEKAARKGEELLQG